MLARTGEDRSLWLNLYGEGTGRRVLERNIARLRLHRVKLHGHVPDRSVIWSKNHAALFASRMEGLSLALLEALALGRMVVSTDVGGAREHIVDGHTGFMVPFPSADALDVTLERAWLVRDQWDGMGVNARSKHHVDGNDPVQRIVALVEQRAASDVVAN
ncbi:MAG: glycosyltransferase family 4 protein [Flavobacteriales bacterium]|nr:glycosyltransferase family 4 protein [Flavobacteriales bacterium]